MAGRIIRARTSQPIGASATSSTSEISSSAEPTPLCDLEPLSGRLGIGCRANRRQPRFDTANDLDQFRHFGLPQQIALLMQKLDLELRLGVDADSQFVAAARSIAACRFWLIMMTGAA